MAHIERQAIGGFHGLWHGESACQDASRARAAHHIETLVNRLAGDFLYLGENPGQDYTANASTS
jgi:hypothetical protein